MTRNSLLRAVAIVALAIAPVVSGCASKTIIDPSPNQTPTVRLTNAPTSTRQIDAYYYAVTLNWVGFDPDGRITRYLYAVDPKQDQDTAWVQTEKNEEILLFRSSNSNPTSGLADDPHTFVLKAVDDDGAYSPVVYRSFFSKTTAPTVQISAPRPGASGRKYVTPAVRITWDGDDVDGVFTKKPVKYKYTLINEQSPVPLTVALADRDSVRRYWVPRAFAGWDSTSAETTQVSYTSLVPNQEYMFVVVAFDEAGAYSPLFTRTTNMLYFRVTFAGSNNPTITFFNEFFSYTYQSGSYEPNNRARYVILELPAGQPVTFNWFALPVEGSEMRSYRWALDIQDLSDDTARQFPTDYSRWSARALNVTSATIGPFPGSTTPHKFFLEAEDINGLVSLGIIEFTSVQATFEKKLLIVKDTRLQADQQPSGSTCVDRPKGRWPTQAELDTFLFAVGGKPWRCYPPGAISKPGLFAGYTYDTIGTRNGKIDQTVRLSRLGQYEQVVWLSEQIGTQSDKDGANQQLPQNALRYMCGPNRLNTLAAYLKQGGRVWLAGGGAMTAPLVEYDNRTSNNNTIPPGTSQTFSVEAGELIPGRFTYDWAKWQVEVKDIKGTLQINKDAISLGRNSANPFYTNPLLPDRLQGHSLAAGDTFPPNRTVNSGDFFYTNMDIEYQSRMVEGNGYIEDVDSGPIEDFRSGLDTLYRAVGATLVGTTFNRANTCMTVYPARELWGLPNYPAKPNVIASGFDLWSFRRTQCKGVVDFVLQQLWSLPAPTGTLASARASSSPLGTSPVLSLPSGATRTPPASISTTRSSRSAPPPGRKPDR